MGSLLTRSNLFAGANQNLGDDTQAARGNLVNQRDEIKRGDELISNLGRDVVSAIDSGSNALVELGRQNEVINHIDDNVGNINDEADIGKNFLTEMIGRDRRKVIILWIIVIIVLSLFIVFLYFVFE